MKKIMHFVLLAAIAAVFSVGCSASMQMTHNEAPIKLDYQIRYSDATALDVVLLMIAPDAPAVNGKTLAKLDEAVSEVSRQVPKSQIIAHQDLFRDKLQQAFTTSAPEIGPLHLVIVGFNESQWQVMDEEQMMTLR